MHHQAQTLLGRYPTQF